MRRQIWFYRFCSSLLKEKEVKILSNFTPDDIQNAAEEVKNSGHGDFMFRDPGLTRISHQNKHSRRKPPHPRRSAGRFTSRLRTLEPENTSHRNTSRRNTSRNLPTSVILTSRHNTARNRHTSVIVTSRHNTSRNQHPSVIVTSRHNTSRNRHPSVIVTSRHNTSRNRHPSVIVTSRQRKTSRRNNVGQGNWGWSTTPDDDFQMEGYYRENNIWWPKRS
ncbi:hypothetical protein BACCIP111895_04214 [Neobacillus rhizosphaerae]|uniref:SH2 domain-containing protein n=1 Tax=Neobacillus rhizosphaerae TaxID=2880965 RepID=A0ABM9EXQ7_9BACI|nr:hypothetical protein BACCIP111895_04214 [Neobacillus rhizosphaerae]